MSEYGSRTIREEKYYSTIPEEVFSVLKEMQFRKESRAKINAFLNDYKRSIQSDDKELVEVLAVLSKYRDENGEKI